jgi:hypothetical protein
MSPAKSTAMSPTVPCRLSAASLQRLKTYHWRDERPTHAGNQPRSCFKGLGARIPLMLCLIPFPVFSRCHAHRIPIRWFRELHLASARRSLPGRHEMVPLLLRALTRPETAPPLLPFLARHETGLLLLRVLARHELTPQILPFLVQRESTPLPQGFSPSSAQ